MSDEGKASTVTMANNDNETNTTTTTTTTTTSIIGEATDVIIEKERSEKILKAKELYSQGSRNFLVKSYAEAADELSQVCALYEELYGELSPELGMPYLLYAKSLIALAVDENKVIDVPDEEADEDDDDDDNDDDEDGEEDGEENGGGDDGDGDDDKEEPKEKEKEKADIEAVSNGTKNHDKVVSTEKPSTVADSTADGGGETNKEATKSNTEGSSTSTINTITTTTAKTIEESQVSSSNDSNVQKTNGTATSTVKQHVADGEKPSTSNGDVDCADADTQEDDEENDAASNLQLAWEILELAAKIFSNQGLNGLSNLAEVQTELANIEFENNIMDAAREDYDKALRIYKDLPKNYHRAMAEIHYKIGLTYLMQQLNKEGAASLKEACDLIEAEITEIRSKEELTEKDKNNIQDMEETKQEIRAKIDEIEETQAQNIAEVRAALDSYIKPIVSQNDNDAGASSSTSSSLAAAKGVSAAGSTSNISSSSSSKPTDISHLIKRKKPEEPSSEAEASPAKRPAI